MSSIFSSLFSSSQFINFYPYVGKSYAACPFKILVLGESHYGPQSKNSYHEWTQDVVENDFLKNLDNGATLPDWVHCHRNTANVLAANRDSNPHEVYDKIAFYNFFQKSVGEGDHADKRYLTDELKAISANALREVMQILKPNLIVGWGWDNLEWKYLPAPRHQIDINRDCAGIHLHLFTLDGFPRIPIWCMHHPSMGININAHRECFAKIKDFLNISF
ncbi:MAG: hypothetical protein MJY47_04820 [Fibrobacter sp.]|nr:hypothetical protein [Fibrobacter sp.]